MNPGLRDYTLVTTVSFCGIAEVSLVVVFEQRWRARAGVALGPAAGRSFT